MKQKFPICITSMFDATTENDDTRNLSVMSTVDDGRKPR